VNELLQWTLDTVRADSFALGWLEERRFEWAPLAHNCLQSLMAGQPVVIVTDNERAWFADYIVSGINKRSKNRPVLPIFSLRAMAAGIENSPDKNGFGDYLDMMDIALKDYIFWYVGRFDDKMASLAKKRDDSFLWIFDERLQNSFYIRSFDDLLDFKLLGMARLFDKTIDAVMFGDIVLEN
jgi:hypothetical protein